MASHVDGDGTVSRAEANACTPCCAYIAVGGTLLVVASFALLYVAIEFFGPGYKWKANSFLRQMKSTTTHTELQEWATSEIARNLNNAELETFPKILNAPKDGMPRTVHVRFTDGPEPYVIAQWGGGFGHWGLVIGGPALRYPNPAYYHIEWAPGVYVWHEIQ